MYNYVYQFWCFYQKCTIGLVCYSTISCSASYTTNSTTISTATPFDPTHTLLDTLPQLSAQVTRGDVLIQGGIYGKGSKHSLVLSKIVQNIVFILSVCIKSVVPYCLFFICASPSEGHHTIISNVQCNLVSPFARQLHGGSQRKEQTISISSGQWDQENKICSSEVYRLYDSYSTASL